MDEYPLWARCNIPNTYAEICAGTHIYTALWVGMSWESTCALPVLAVLAKNVHSRLSCSDGQERQGADDTSNDHQ